MDAHEIQDRIGAVARLAQLKNVDMSADLQKLYFEELKDVPRDALLAACVRCGRAMTYAMPEPAAIRATADVVLHEVWQESQRGLKSLPPKPGTPEHPFEHCPICHDDPGAWVIYWCHGGREGGHRQPYTHASLVLPEGHCGRDREHASHSYADTNHRRECLQAPWRAALRPPKPLTHEVPGGKSRRGDAHARS